MNKTNIPTSLDRKNFFTIAFLLLFSLILLYQITLASKENKKVAQEKKSLEEKRIALERQAEIFSHQIEINSLKEKKANELLEQANKRIHEMANLDNEEAKKIVLENAKKDISDELNYLASCQLKDLKKKIHRKTTDLLCSSFERYSSEIAFSKTAESILVSDETASRIIGKDGRNINFFRSITGTDIIVAKGKSFPVKNSKADSFITVEISCFDSLRREVAIQTLKKLVDNDKKITPLYIEKTFGEVSININETIIQTAETVIEDLGLSGFSLEMMKSIGRLKYRTSYGQNVLDHSIEVARISGTIAAELELNPEVAKRAGLLHDIGKSAEDLVGLSHVTSGVLLAKKHNESETILNAIASHHDRMLANNPYSLVIAAADTLSAARPGARSNQIESYITRMRELEEIGNSFEGIKKMYSFQAGREIWVIVDSSKVSDFECLEMLKDVRVMIEETVVIPGDVTISLVREKKIVEKIVNSGRSIKKTNERKY